MGLLWELAESQMFCRDTTLLLTDNQTAGQQQLYCIIMLTYFAQFLKLRSHLQSFSQILQAKSSHSNGNPMQILQANSSHSNGNPCKFHSFSSWLHRFSSRASCIATLLSIADNISFWPQQFAEILLMSWRIHCLPKIWLWKSWWGHAITNPHENDSSLMNNFFFLPFCIIVLNRKCLQKLCKNIILWNYEGKRVTYKMGKMCIHIKELHIKFTYK